MKINMQTKNAIIIGSGVAGLATAIRLAVQGYDVRVFEKNSGPGGKLSAFENNGFHFDQGPSLFTQPQNMEELFELAGEPIGNYFNYVSVDIACKYFYENGKVVNAFTNTSDFDKELQVCVHERPGNLLAYLKESERIYENIGTVFINHSLHKISTWMHKRIFHAMAYVRYCYLFSSLNNYNRRKFTSPEAIQLFNRFATYNGSNPYRAPGMLSMIPHLEQNQGTFYPKGGMISVKNALYRLALTKGVKFYFDSPVHAIIHHAGRVKGVVVNGENIYTGIVVSNVDVYFTYKELLRNDYKAKSLLRQERSSSAVIFYWGIKKSFPGLQLHNIFFSKDYEREFEGIFNKKLISTDPTVYINITSKMENELAPAGKENWFVMVNAPANTGQDWKQVRQNLRNSIICKLNRMLDTDLEQLIETEDISDPALIEEQTASYMGSLYGTSSNSKLAAFFRQANYTDNIKGLFFCGGSVHPGGGIPLCLKSARIVGELISQHK